MNCGYGFDIDREDWEDGFGLSRFDLTPVESGHPNNYLVPRQNGNINLYLIFHTLTPAVINLILYEEFQNQLEIERNQRVVYDLSQGS